MNLFIAYVVIASPKPKGGKEMDVYAGNNKKMLNMLILGILKKYTDSEHLLTQQEIIDLLYKNHEAECDRRSVHNNIQSLKDWAMKYIQSVGAATWGTGNLKTLSFGC